MKKLWLDEPIWIKETEKRAKVFLEMRHICLKVVLYLVTPWQHAVIIEEEWLMRNPHRGLYLVWFCLWEDSRRFWAFLCLVRWQMDRLLSGDQRICPR